MLSPLIVGSIVGTFAPGFLELGSFTTAPFAGWALPLIAVLIFANGMHITTRASGPVPATTGTPVPAANPGFLPFGEGSMAQLASAVLVPVISAPLLANGQPIALTTRPHRTKGNN